MRILLYQLCWSSRNPTERSGAKAATQWRPSSSVRLCSPRAPTATSHRAVFAITPFAAAGARMIQIPHLMIFPPAIIYRPGRLLSAAASCAYLSSRAAVIPVPDSNRNHANQTLSRLGSSGWRDLARVIEVPRARDGRRGGGLNVPLTALRCFVQVRRGCRKVFCVWAFEQFTDDDDTG